MNIGFDWPGKEIMKRDPGKRHALNRVVINI